MNSLIDSQNIEDLVLMSIGTEKGSWFAHPEFGSELYKIEKVDVNTALSVQRMIVQATDWLCDDGLAIDIQVTAQRSGRNQIDWQLNVRKPDQSTELLEGVWRL